MDSKNYAQLEIVRSRLAAQRISNTEFKNPDEVVRWMGAVQAQDFLGSLWAIGLRLPRATESDVERAIAEKQIVRTWPMRGTLHFVPATDARWMTALLAPRVIKRNTRRLEKDFGIDARVLSRSRKILKHALEGKRCLTREGVFAILHAGGVAANPGVGLHIVWRLAQEGLLCLGPRAGKQHTFVLLDEWVPNSREVDQEEGLAILAQRYFTSHGPATIRDFAWWSGMPIGEAARCVASVRSRLSIETVAGHEYWRGETNAFAHNCSIHLLPAFDEFMIGYSDRSASVHPSYQRRGIVGFGIMSPMVVTDCRVIGTWGRKIAGIRVTIEVGRGIRLDKVDRLGLESSARRYGTFLGRTASVKYSSRKGSRHEIR